MPRNPRCADAARRFLARELKGRVDPAVLDDALVVASELVTNAYRHGYGAIELRVSRRADRLRIEAIDEGEGATIAVRERPDLALGGWGLELVAALSVAWGAFEGTTHVWAELPVSDGRPR